MKGESQKRHARKRQREEDVKKISGWRIMWTWVTYDLPTKTDEDKARYRIFHNILLDMGFDMLQFSVYARPSPNEEVAEALGRQLQKQIPIYGRVRIFRLTDKQFGEMKVFEGKKQVETENAPQQLTFF